MLLYKVQFSAQKHTNFHILRHNHHKNAGTLIGADFWEGDATKHFSVSEWGVW